MYAKIVWKKSTMFSMKILPKDVFKLVDALRWRLKESKNQKN